MIRLIPAMVVAFVTPVFADSASPTAVDELREFLAQESSTWEDLPHQPFASVALGKADAQQAKRQLIEYRREQLRHLRRAEHEARELSHGEFKMPFIFKKFGESTAQGRRLYVSMHGGGNAPKSVNDRQWKNQQRLYEPKEGIYVAPRAPTDTWDLWHQSQILPLFDRLIEDLVIFEDVDPNRVYLMGYSAGGDGVYQMAPRMADRLAAAAMMAGHPNDANPLNLRNLGFALYMGGKDAAYNRNQVVVEWAEQLKALQSDDGDGYRYLAVVYPEKGHWMDGEDASAVPWMAQFRREPFPKKVVWRKDRQPQNRFYWLGADTASWQPGEVVTATVTGQVIELSARPKGMQLYLDDELVDLDQEVTIRHAAEERTVKPQRSIAAMHHSLTDRFDPAAVYATIVDEY